MPFPPENDKRFFDPLSRPPAGYSLTKPKGQWNWDRPPKYPDPEEALDFIFSKVTTPKVEERYLKLMLAGITVEEIVKSLAIGGFMDGAFTPDVAELIKGPLTIHFAGLAAENQIPVRVLSTATGLPDDRDELSDDSLLNIMREKNPKVYRQLVDKNNQTMQELYAKHQQEQEVAQNSFLGVEE
jgi:hypothetical protein